MRARIAALIAGLCVLTGCGLVLGIEEIEKPTGADGGSGVDGGSGAEAGGTFCERNTGHDFCEDFDRGANPKFVLRGTGNASVADGDALWPSRSLLTTCSPSAEEASTAAAPWSSSASKFTTVSIELDVYLERTSSSSEIVQFLKFVFDDAGGPTEIGVGLAPGRGGYVFESKDQQYATFINDVELPIGNWFHVAFAVHASSPKATFDLSVEGQPKATKLELGHALDPAEVNALVGIAYVPKGPASWKVRIDNVLIDGTE